MTRDLDGVFVVDGAAEEVEGLFCGGLLVLRGGCEGGWIGVGGGASSCGAGL